MMLESDQRQCVSAKTAGELSAATSAQDKWRSSMQNWGPQDSHSGSQNRKGHNAHTLSNDGASHQRLASSHSMNGALGSWARATPSQVD
jgi:hypothetical protein